jgi:hypothetical protein
VGLTADVNILEKFFFPLPGIEQRFLGRPDSSVGTTPTAFCRIDVTGPLNLTCGADNFGKIWSISGNMELTTQNEE